MGDFKRNVEVQDGTVWLAAVGTKDNEPVAYVLTVFGLGKSNCQAFYSIHQPADRPDHTGQESCDYFPHFCRVWSDGLKSYPNYSEGDLWDVLMVRSGVNV